MGTHLVTCSNFHSYGPVSGPITESLPLAAVGAMSRVRAHVDGR